MKAVECRDLTFAYADTPVLDGVTFSIDEGNFLAVIGPNGGGKTTLLKLILGLHRPSSGTLRVFGDDPSQARRRIGYVPQHVQINLDFPITVEEVILTGYRGKTPLLPFRSDEERRCAKEALAQVGLSDDLLKRRIGDLSGGQRQRVMIARALCSKPQMIVLDEPTASIDATGQKAIYDLLKKLNASMTVIVVSHDLSVILEYADKALYVNRFATFHDIADKSSVFHTHGDAGHFCEVELLEMLGAEACRSCNKEEA